MGDWNEHNGDLLERILSLQRDNGRLAAENIRLAADNRKLHTAIRHIVAVIYHESGELDDPEPC